jgi:hypothetical protein
MTAAMVFAAGEITPEASRGRFGSHPAAVVGPLSRDAEGVRVPAGRLEEECRSFVITAFGSKRGSDEGTLEYEAGHAMVGGDLEALGEEVGRATAVATGRVEGGDHDDRAGSDRRRAVLGGVECEASHLVGSKTG